MSFSRTKPYFATLKERYLLTKPGSSKLTYHVSLNIENSGMEFLVGDSIGIYAQNDPTLVQHLLHALGAQGDEKIQDHRTKEILTVRNFLSKKANLSRLTSSFLKLVYEHETYDKKNQISTLLLPENKTLLLEYLAKHDPLDILKEYNGSELPLQDVCAQFGPLLPRFYSIASSPKVMQHTVDLTVALSTYTHSGEKRYGVASHFLCNLCEINETQIPIYVQPANGFTLPQDPKAPMIMIGPGTGIAPFRAFLQERHHLGAEGKNWLFFGERHRKYDFFYEDFFQTLVNQERLRMDVAFSRDQEEKLYVQHKMEQCGADLWSWLQDGAYLFICGDAQDMAKDVEKCLKKIAIEHGQMNEDEAKAYFKNLRSEKRYLLDVY